MLMPFDHVAEYIKAKDYVQEPLRFKRVNRNTIVWRGASCVHLLVCVDRVWHCDCSYGGQSHLPCSHLRAWEQLSSVTFCGPDNATQDAS